MLTELKNFDANRASIEEMVALRAFARNLVSEYTAQEVDVPEWIATQTNTLDTQIAAKNRERLLARRKESTARLENYKTPTQKQAELKREIAAIDRKLGIGA